MAPLTTWIGGSRCDNLLLQEECKMKRFITAMVALSMCIAPGIILADGNGWQHFKGTYEMTASGSCIHSEKGFTYELNRQI